MLFKTWFLPCFKKFVEEVKDREKDLETVNKNGEAFLAEAKVNEHVVFISDMKFLWIVMFTWIDLNRVLCYWTDSREFTSCPPEGLKVVVLICVLLLYAHFVAVLQEQIMLLYSHERILA